MLQSPTDPQRCEVGDFAWILVKQGDTRVIIPTPIPEESAPLLSIAKSIPGVHPRQIIVKVPFTDERAEDILTKKARQLPKHGCGLLMVNVGGQPTAMDSWPQLIPPRFTPAQHTRVAGVLLFQWAFTGTIDGIKRVIYFKLIPNPHARRPLPTWLAEHIDKTRAESRRLTTFGD